MLPLALGSYLLTNSVKAMVAPAPTTLGASQLLQYARQAGFNPEEAKTMAAIALAESGGNPRAYNPNASTGDLSYGLTQINMLGGMGPARRKQFGLSTNEQLFDPLTNLRAAKKVKEEAGGFSPWSVYKSGAYKSHLDAVNKANQSGPQATAPSATQIPQQLPTSGGGNDVFVILRNPKVSVDDPLKNFAQAIISGALSKKASIVKPSFDPLALLNSALNPSTKYYDEPETLV